MNHRRRRGIKLKFRTWVGDDSLTVCKDLEIKYYLLPEEVHFKFVGCHKSDSIAIVRCEVKKN